MRRTAISGGIAVLILLHSQVSAQRAPRITIDAGEACPPGTTEVRPGSCQAPQLEPPSIVDYRPESTLITEEHQVPKPKYPAIDFHGHPPGLDGSPEGLARLESAMDEIGLRVMIAASNVRGDRLRQVLAGISASPTMRDRVRVFTGIEFGDLEPGWVERAVQQLEADVAAGAVGIGEISKSLGLGISKPDGSRLRIDDPVMDPIWEAAARLNIPVFIHTGDPAEFFEELDYTNERWLELALFPNRRYPQGRYPSFEQLVQERDNLFRRHPNTTFVTAHMGWQANDLATLGALLDELPNVHTEVGAVLYDIGRQPRNAREFFIKYQDRILFGKDSFQPVEYPYYWRVFETRDDYFDYYRPYHAFWKLYGMTCRMRCSGSCTMRMRSGSRPGCPRKAGSFANTLCISP
ncbi:MAG TPA: amidohydrolase family protein [Longimicrobiales bacterium]|nr:amidohydrolase family protein [Longimicrobiales bacterium]